jgi:hypothetical protein
VNGDLTPALVAAGSGSAMITGIWLHEHRQAEAMRRSRVRLGLRFPIGLEPSQALAALDGLAGLPHTSELIAEVVAGEDSIAHFLWVPQSVRASAQSTMAGVIPSLRITDAPPSPDDEATLALRLTIPASGCVLSSENAVAASRALLSGMVGLRSDEQVIVRVALRPDSPRSWQEPEHPSDREREVAKHWRHKTSLPGFTTAGLVLFRARHMSRARELAAHIENTIRSRRQIGGVRATREHGNRTLASMPRTTRASGWLSTPELLGLTGWPLGSEVAVAGVEVGAARALPVPSSVPREGRRLFIGRDGSGAKRPVALSAEAARHHVIAAGVSGSGKSTMIARAVLSDIEHGYGGVVIDPKADLVETILERVKPEHAERVIVLDAGDDSRPVAGIDVLHGGDPDTRADVLTRTLKSMFDWTIRSEIWGRLAIRTASGIPSSTLLDVGRLFEEEPYRRTAVARLSDDFLKSSWQNYEALSPAAKVDVVQAPMARLMALLSRPRVRAVLASPEPKLDVARLLAERKWLLVSLAPGALGEASTLIGSAVMFAVWSAIEARVALPPEERHLINIYVDELATLTNGLPNSFELIAERARGLGAGLTVALQTLGRIPEPTKSALLGNAATFITFRAPAEEAPGLARQLPGLTAQDVQSLGRFEVAARVGTGTGSAVSVVTGRTEPLPPETGQAKAIRDRSARLYGSTQQPQVRHEQPARSESDDDDPVGVQRRRA